MRRHLFLFAVALLALAGYAGAQASTVAHKTVICHATKSTKKPYKRIVTANRALIRAHTVSHHGDIINPAGGICPSQQLSFSRGGRPISAALTPVPPNTVGSGTFIGRSNVGQGRICWKLTVSADVTDVTAAHIHRVSDSSIVVPLTLPSPFTGTATGCDNAPRAIVKQILMHPANFYANVHTTTYPAGALRGDLHKGAKP